MCDYSSAVAENAEEKRAKEIAIRMIRANKLTDAEIAEYAGLTTEKVKKLRDDESVPA